MPLRSRSGPTVIFSTASGTQNAWAPGIKGDTIIYWDGAGGSLSINGISSVGVAPGTRVTLKNVTSGFAQLGLAHANGSAAVADRLTNFFTGILTPVFQRGFAQLIWDGVNWQLVDHSSGISVTPSFVAGDYTPQPSGTWTVATGDVTTRIWYIKKRVVVALNVATTTVARNAADPTTLRIASNAWAGGLTAGGSTPQTFPCVISDNGTRVVGVGTIASGATVVNFQRSDGAQFANSTDNTGIWANFSAECN